MKIIYNNIIPFKGFSAINLFGILFVRNGCTVSDTMIRHESIHTKQIQELGYIFFYILYCLEWLLRLFINGIQAYYMISFEQEAYKNQDDNDYINNRKHYAWIKYIFNFTSFQDDTPKIIIK